MVYGGNFNGPGIDSIYNNWASTCQVPPGAIVSEYTSFMDLMYENAAHNCAVQKKATAHEVANILEESDKKD